MEIRIESESLFQDVNEILVTASLSSIIHDVTLEPYLNLVSLHVRHLLSVVMSPQEICLIQLFQLREGVVTALNKR